LNLFPNAFYYNTSLHRIYLAVLNKQCFLAHQFETVLHSVVY